MQWPKLKKIVERKISILFTRMCYLCCEAARTLAAIATKVLDAVFVSRRLIYHSRKRTLSAERCNDGFFVYGPITIAIRARFEYDSTTIRLRFERDTTSYEELCAFEQ